MTAGWIRRVSAFCLIPAQFRDTSQIVSYLEQRNREKMGNSRLIFTLILGVFTPLFIQQGAFVAAGDAVPVLIWDGESTGSPSSPVNPLQKTSQAEFEKIVMKKVGGTPRPVLVFVRDNLCVEDFTQHKEGLMHLKDGGTLVYLPAVDSPLSVFENLPFYNQTTEEELESVADGQLIVTKATDLDAISETFNMVKESSPNLIAALTGRSCSYSRSERVRRAADSSTTTPAPSPDTGYIVKTARILMYASDKPVLTLSESEDVTTELTGYKQEGEGTRESPLALNLEYSIKNKTSPSTASVLLSFPETSSGYYFTKAEYRDAAKNVTLVSKEDFTFPFNFSYHCSQQVKFGNGTVIFTITGFQVQIDADKFGDAYDCVGFTSIPIWAGIFVTTILAIIMIWGLTMIMDIRTMDRFDDPKGKTITISTTE